MSKHHFINIYQDAYQTHFPELDFKSAAIVDFMSWFVHTSGPSMEKKIEGDKVYYWFDYGNIARMLPILKLEPVSVRRRVRELCQCGILEPHKDNMGSRPHFAFGPKFHLTRTTNGATTPRAELHDPLVQNCSPLVQNCTTPSCNSARPPRAELHERYTNKNDILIKGYTQEEKGESRKKSALAPTLPSETPIPDSDVTIPDPLVEDDATPLVTPPHTTPAYAGDDDDRTPVGGEGVPDIYEKPSSVKKTRTKKQADPREPRLAELRTLIAADEKLAAFYADAAPAWEEWIAYKWTEKREKYKAAGTELLALRGWAEENQYDVEIAAAAARRSMRSGYKGLFPLPKPEVDAIYAARKSAAPREPTLLETIRILPSFQAEIAARRAAYEKTTLERYGPNIAADLLAKKPWNHHMTMRQCTDHQQRVIAHGGVEAWENYRLILSEILTMYGYLEPTATMTLDQWESFRWDNAEHRFPFEAASNVTKEGYIRELRSRHRQWYDDWCRHKHDYLRKHGNFYNFLVWQRSEQINLLKDAMETKRSRV